MMCFNLLSGHSIGTRKAGDLDSTPSECQIFICSVASFLMCCPCEALEGPISTRVGII